MHPSALHHVELCVANGKKIASYFTEKLGYSLRAQRDTLLSQQWVVGSQKSTFVVTEKKKIFNCQFLLRQYSPHPFGQVTVQGIISAHF